MREEARVQRLRPLPRRLQQVQRRHLANRDSHPQAWLSQPHLRPALLLRSQRQRRLQAWLRSSRASYLKRIRK